MTHQVAKGRSRTKLFTAH
uniref:Uncharacterized protein n=1 Tax=Macrostomum lignano TaxID=282301 RepID=A0A1I8JCA4_9PLAT